MSSEHFEHAAHCFLLRCRRNLTRVSSQVTYRCLCCFQGFLLVFGGQHFSCDVFSLLELSELPGCVDPCFSIDLEVFSHGFSNTLLLLSSPLPAGTWIPWFQHDPCVPLFSACVIVTSRSSSSPNLFSDSLHPLLSSYSEFFVIVLFNFKISTWFFLNFSLLIFSI